MTQEEILKELDKAKAELKRMEMQLKVIRSFIISPAPPKRKRPRPRLINTERLNNKLSKIKAL